MELKRYFSEEDYNHLREDISGGRNPLIQTINNSCGEIDFQIRPDSKFNLYFQGNSLSQVIIQKTSYKILIHEKFDPVHSALKDPNGRFTEDMFSKHGKHYFCVTVKRSQLLKFFQSKIIEALASNIKKVNFGEEITFEQSLITDNLGNSNFIIIDRQVSWSGIRKRVDLLGLRKVSEGVYRFVVLEVKLGNNPDLKEKVVNQIEFYIREIQDNISVFQACYEKNYLQKKGLGLFPGFSENNKFPESIKIDDKVEGRIVVGLYSNIGRQYIEELSKKFPEWQLDKTIIQFKNKLFV